MRESSIFRIRGFSSGLLRSPTDSSQRSLGRATPSLPGLLRWSFRDTNRVKISLPSFQNCNPCLKRTVDLWYHASQLGVCLDYPHHLHTAHYSRELGVDEDKSLCLAQSDTGKMSSSLELLFQSWVSCLTHIEPVKHQGMFAIFSMDRVAYSPLLYHLNAYTHTHPGSRHRFTQQKSG